MPLFTYRCLTCHDGWTEQRYTAQRDAAIQCPRCKSWNTRRTCDAPNFIVKGLNAKNGYSK